MHVIAYDEFRICELMHMKNLAYHNGRRFGLSTGFQNQNPVLESKMAAVLALQQAFKTKIQFWKAKWPPFWPCNRLSKPKSSFGKQNGLRFGLATGFQN